MQITTMKLDEKYGRFIEQFPGPVQRNELLAPYTSYHTGGEADLFAEITDSDSMAKAIRLANELGVPYFVLGGGSNLLISDRGYRGLILRNRICGLKVEGNEILSGAGELLDDAVDYATSCSLTGAEFAAGIWGTMGGAVYGNAGAFGSQISVILKWAELVDKTGRIRTEEHDYFAFLYRHSKLKSTGETVTQVCLQLVPGDRDDIARRTADIRRLRAEKHPVTAYTAGCFFKNIEDATQPHGKLPAGKLLEEAGARDLIVGHARVFSHHANILVNTGGATSEEIRHLADILKKRVKDRFGIELQEEVICLGDFSKEVVSTDS